jgi:glycosyltransferase involved in cell wall biosynthesis
VVSEAMVSGTPPILSDRCGNWGYSDTVRHRYNGLVYPCGKVEALTKAILEMTDAEARRKYSERSREVFGEQDLYCEVNAFLEVAERIQAKQQKSTQTLVQPVVSASSDRIPVEIP